MTWLRANHPREFAVVNATRDKTQGLHGLGWIQAVVAAVGAGVSALTQRKAEKEAAKLAEKEKREALLAQAREKIALIQTNMQRANMGLSPVNVGGATATTSYLLPALAGGAILVIVLLLRKK